MLLNRRFHEMNCVRRLAGQQVILRQLDLVAHENIPRACGRGIDIDDGPGKLGRFLEAAAESPKLQMLLDHHQPFYLKLKAESANQSSLQEI